MQQTFNYKIQSTDNDELFDLVFYNHTGLFYKLYNNLELSEDKSFIKECLDNFQVDKTIYDYTLKDAKLQYEAFLEKKEEKKEKLSQINKRLSELNNKPTLSNYDVCEKKKLLKNKSYIQRTIDKNICFGGKDLLRTITKLKQKENKTKKDLKRLRKTEKEYKENRKRNIFLWGKAIEGGNRKMDFYFDKGYIVLKLSKNKQIKIFISPQNGNKRIGITNELQNKINAGNIAVTVRVCKDRICVSFDNEVLNGFGFDTTAFNLEVKNNPDKSAKEIKKEFYDKQTQNKLKGKIKNRVLGFDLNPEYIGMSISDINIETGEVDKVVFNQSFCLKHYTEKKTLTKKERDKFNYEIVKVYDKAFEIAKHYNVSHCGIEELKGITTSGVSNKGRHFNRLTKNAWNRELQVELIKMRCDGFGIICNEVSALYSSFIGNIKHGFFDPSSASVEIGRRSYLKYKKNIANRFYPSIGQEDYEKMSYLISHDMSNYKTWVSLYKEFNKKDDSAKIGGWWRNKSFTEGGFLDSVKSNVVICY